jgi:hypothetical protein
MSHWRWIADVLLVPKASSLREAFLLFFMSAKSHSSDVRRFASYTVSHVNSPCNCQGFYRRHANFFSG